MAATVISIAEYLDSIRHSGQLHFSQDECKYILFFHFIKLYIRRVSFIVLNQSEIEALTLNMQSINRVSSLSPRTG